MYNNVLNLKLRITVSKIVVTVIVIIIIINYYYLAEFTNHTSCYHNLRKTYDSCTGPEDWMKNPGKEFVCR